PVVHGREGVRQSPVGARRTRLHSVTKSLTVLMILSIGSLSELRNCGKSDSPTASYEAFADSAAEGDCKAVYKGLDADSQARVRAGLDTLAALALAVRDHAEGGKRANGPGAAPGTEPSTEGDGGKKAEPKGADGGPSDATEGKADNTGPDDPQSVGAADLQGTFSGTGDDEDESLDERERLKNRLLDKYKKKREADKKKKTRNALSKLRGKALFLALCQDSPPDLGTLFRERRVTRYAKQPIKSEKVKGDRATLKIDVDPPDKKKGKGKKKKKKAKGKKKDKNKDKEAKPKLPEPDPIEMVKERGGWKLVLPDTGVEWQRQEDGRWLPVFKSPILVAAVETDPRQTPTRAYNRLRESLLARDCSAFYSHVDSESKARLRRFVPMVMALASAFGTKQDEPSPATRVASGDARLTALCQRAAREGGRFAGIQLGTVVSEDIESDVATLTMAVPKATRRKKRRKPPTLTMVREDGEWKLSLDPLTRLTASMDMPKAKPKADKGTAAREAEAGVASKDAGTPTQRAQAKGDDGTADPVSGDGQGAPSPNAEPAPTAPSG
ncbi:MAG: hypothetical protein OXU20_17575, partial [Myxococcales bacterium]|nr:hypothetical protein [Myxococcales bacterium]